VVIPGKAVLEIYTGKPFVLAYRADSSFVSVAEGDQVRVSNAGRSTRGRVQKILPLAQALPPEFQKPIQARGRGQVLRISLADPGEFVMEQKVHVAGCYIAACDDVAGVAKRALTQLVEWIGQGSAAALSWGGQGALAAGTLTGRVSGRVAHAYRARHR